MPIDRNEWALGVAEAVALRADCSRRQVGAIILDVRHRIIGAGYNGTRPGDGLSCAGGDCPRGRHYRDERVGWACEHHRDKPNMVCLSCEGIYLCNCGNPWPCPDAVAPGSSYDTGEGACISTHAELNAVMDVSDKLRLAGARLYVTSEPCDGCLKIIRNTTPISQVRWPEGVVEFP